MKIKEIRALLTGRVISLYDGWNGSSEYFRIGYVEKGKKHVRVYSEKGKGYPIWLTDELLHILLDKGVYIEKNEMEGCPFEVRYTLD